VNIIYLNAKDDRSPEIWERILQGSTVACATRPISGEEDWEGDWLHGRHYAAGDRSIWEQHWEAFDAWEVVIVSNAEIEKRVREEAKKRPFGNRFDDLVEKKGVLFIKECAMNWLKMPYFVGEN
jgi:hypothetical protein